ncbi:hypothetical protein L208DRAFT_33486 [Tricholoma matsutake]|nr:hypothetical protein L208DRAFT_33486 [Tricholoma matsutake 945]
MHTHSVIHLSLYHAWLLPSVLSSTDPSAHLGSASFSFFFPSFKFEFFFPSLGMFEKTLAFTRKIPWILNGIGFWFFFVRSRWCFVLSCLFCVAAKSEGGKGGRLIDKLPVPIQIQIAIANQALSFAVERVDSAHCQQPHPV